MTSPTTTALQLARAPGRRSRLLTPADAAALRCGVDELVDRAHHWRPPPRDRDDAPPAPDELLLTVLAAARSDETRRAYARDIALWLAWLRSHGQDPYAAGAAHVEAYLRELEDRGLAEASRARALAAISAYFRRGVHEQAMPSNPCDVVRRPAPASARQNQARALSREQARTLLAAARDRGALHELLVQLLVFNGLRATEAATVLVADVGEHQGHRVVKVQGKGERERNVRVPLAAPTIAALERWMPDRARLVQAGVDELLVSQTGRALTRQAIHGLIARLARSAGVGPLSPHGLRATMVTLALDAGMPLRDVQDSARHADPRTTRRYDRDRGRLSRAAALRLAELADEHHG